MYYFQPVNGFVFRKHTLASLTTLKENRKALLHLFGELLTSSYGKEKYRRPYV